MNVGNFNLYVEYHGEQGLESLRRGIVTLCVKMPNACPTCGRDVFKCVLTLDELRSLAAGFAAEAKSDFPFFHTAPQGQE